MNKKVESFKQTVFLSEQCAVQKVTTLFEAQAAALTQAHNHLATHLLPWQ